MEAQTLARLKHPGIAAVYDVGVTADGRGYFAMELVEGTRLDRYIADRTLPLERKLDLFQKICRAVHYAHQCGVIHRDLKPSNVFIDPRGEPKILDFGLARVAGWDLPVIGWASAALLVVLAPWLFQYSRVLWLWFDQRFDPR